MAIGGKIRRAVLFGVADYGPHDLPGLPAVAEDLPALATALERQLHPDHRYEVHRFLNKDVNVRNISRELERLGRDTKADEIFVYLAGHGCLLHGTGYFCTYGGDQYQPGKSLQEIARLLEKLPARRVIAVLDFCHAGALLTQRTPLVGEVDPLGRDSERLSVLAAARAGESVDASPSAPSLTRTLCDVLVNLEMPNGLVSWLDVASEVSKRLRDAPQHTVNRSIHAADHIVNWKRPLAPAPTTEVATALQIPGLRDFEWMKTRTFPIGTMSLSFSALQEKGLLFPRRVADRVLDDLVQEGTALGVGASGSGKTCLAFQLAARFLRGEVPMELRHLQVRYTTLADVTMSDLVRLLERPGPLLLIVDDVHQDEDGAVQLRREWKIRHTGKFLLFLTQPYFGEDDENRPNNIFREYGTPSKLGADPEELAAYVRHRWQSPEGPSDVAVARIRWFSAGSLAVAALAVEAYQSSQQQSQAFNEREFEDSLSTLIRRTYRLDPVQEAATRATWFAYFDIPIVPAAFGPADAQALVQRGYLTSASQGRELTVFARVFGDIQQRVSPLDDKKLGDALVQYIQHPDANYLQVLSCIRRSGHFDLLYYVVNNGLNILRERLHEASPDAAALTLENIRACSYGAARSALDSVLLRRPLADYLYRNNRYASAASAGRLLHIVSVLRRDLFPETPPGGEPPLDIALLEEILRQPGTSALDAGRLCTSVARCSRSWGKHLLDLAIERGDLVITDGEQDDQRLQEKLRFIAMAAVIDRGAVDRLSQGLDPARLASIVRRTRRPIAARSALEGAENVSRRCAQEAIRRVVAKEGFAAWAEALLKSPTHLYHLAHLILDIRHISPRGAATFAQLLAEPLCMAIAGDRRLAAIGFLLNVLRRVNSIVAKDVLDVIDSQSILTDLLGMESNPVRVGLALASAARIDKLSAYNSVQLVARERWALLVTQSRNLYALAILVRGLAEASYDPDAAVDRLLADPGVRKSIADLSKRCRSVAGLVAFAEIVSVSCPLSAGNRQRLLAYIKPQQFEKFLDGEHNIRIAGMGLRAYAVAFPAEADRFASTLLASTQRRKPSPLFKTWGQVEDVSSAAFLISSAAELDARLGTAIARGMRNVLDALRREARPARAAELIHALSRVDAEAGGRLVEELYKGKDLVETLESTTNLRELVSLLEACRSGHNEFYHSWYRRSRGRAGAIQEELAVQFAEESNLGVIGRGLALLASLDPELARAMSAQLDLDWVGRVGRHENHVAQVLTFVSAAADIEQQRYARPGDGARVGTLANLLRGEVFLAQVGDLRTVRALCFALPKLFRAMQLLGRDAGEIWARMSHDAILGNVLNSNDPVGCGVLALQLSRLGAAPQARRIAEAAEAHVLEIAEHHAPTAALFGLALVGASSGDLVRRRVLARLAPGGVRHEVWEIGFANWLAQQKALATRRPAIALFVTPGAYEPLLVGGEDRSELILEGCERAGGNLELAFTLACARQMRWTLNKRAAERIAKKIKLRQKWESRSDRRMLLDLVSQDAVPLPALNIHSVSTFVRELAPRLEALLLPDEADLISQVS